MGLSLEKTPYKFWPLETAICAGFLKKTPALLASTRQDVAVPFFCLA